jgi:protein ImuB
LIIDATGCSHLWGGDKFYVEDIIARFQKHGYTVRVAIADTIGAAWAVARFSKDKFIIEPGQQSTALLSLPASALRLDVDTVDRLNKLGLRQVKDFIGMPKSALRRRFSSKEFKIQNSKFKIPKAVSSQNNSADIITRINQALGLEEEMIQPIHPIEPYQERLPCLEPIATATGIEMALQRLLESLCKRLKQEGK